MKTECWNQPSTYLLEVEVILRTTANSRTFQEIKSVIKAGALVFESAR